MATESKNPQVEKLLIQAEQLSKKLDWLGAANLCREATAIEPENINTLGQLGWYLSRSKQYDEAIKIYEKLTALESRLAKWPYMLGYQYYDQQLWKEAISWFDQALARYENYLIVLYRKGYAHTQLSENDMAISTFEKCVKAWENLSAQDKDKEKKPYSDTCFQLGKIYLSTGLTRKAESVLSEAVKFDSQDAHKFYEYGKALLKNQKAEEALNQFQKAEKIEPRKEYIIAHIAQALLELSRVDEANKVLIKIPEKNRKEYIWRIAGRVKLAQGKTKEAIQDINRGISLDSKNHNAYYQLGTAYIADNNHLQAYRALSKAIEIRKSVYNLDFPEAKQKLEEVEEFAKNNALNLDSTTEKVSESPMGIIVKYNSSKGFGFIKRSDGEKDIFFHISEVKNQDDIKEGQGVNYIVEDSPKGLKAKNITFLENI